MKPTLILLLLATSLAWAADPTPPATQTCLPDHLIAAEAFDKPESFTKGKQPGTEGWRGGIGEWSIKDGAAYAVQEGPSEKRPNGHEAVCEHIVDLGDLVLTGEFKLGASPQVGFVCRDTNQPNHHLGRVVIEAQHPTPTGDSWAGGLKSDFSKAFITVGHRTEPGTFRSGCACVSCPSYRCPTRRGTRPGRSR